MKKPVVIAAVLLAVIMFCLKVLEFGYFNRSIRSEIYIGIIVSASVLIGVWLGREFLSRKNREFNEVVDVFDTDRLRAFGLSKREVEILTLIEKGHSNQQIADEMFISLSTVKSHTTNLYSKLDVKNRVQAIQRAKSL